jgi:DHA2 family multidrug resistance protein
MIIVGRLVGKIDSRLLMTFGFFVLATSMYLLAGVNLEIASSNIVWPSLINGFAMGFIFVPLTTIAMGTLRRDQMGNAAGIYSLMRNIGGGLGISAVTTLLARGAQQHQAVMVSHLTPYDSAFQQRLQQLQGTFGSSVTGMQKAYGVVYGMLLRQANLLAFIDNFRLLTFVCLACIPLVFLFGRVKGGEGASAAMH